MRRLTHLFTPLFAAALCAAAVAISQRTCGTARAGGPVARRPVLLELFTSEGCSSCPPADALLARIVREQPVPGAEVIALELHVDIWNQLGWADPFSNTAFTARQRTYADTFGQRSVYTPELVVDGASDLVGSNEPGARAAIAAAAQGTKARVDVSRSGDKLSITIADLVETSDVSDVWLAITEDGLATAVPRGENAGATIVHGPVVRQLVKLSSIAPRTRGPVTLQNVELTLKPDWRRERLRAVVFVQRRTSMRIAGAGVTSLY